MGAIILGLVINMISGGTNKENFGEAGWSSFDTEVMTASSDEVRQICKKATYPLNIWMMTEDKKAAIFFK